MKASGAPHPALRATFSPQAGRRISASRALAPRSGERVAEGRVRGAFAVLVFLLATAAPAATRTIATANAASCDIGTYAAATLLLPYFEVEYDQPQNEGLNTVFTVINTSAAPQIVRVTIWTDWGFPATYFSMFLTGYDAHTISMYDILARGNYPVTSSMTPVGANSTSENPHFYSEIWCEHAGGSIGPDAAHRLQRMLTTGEYKEPGCRVGGVHPYAVGYVTLDVVNSCAVDSPMSDTYWKEVILYDNVLTGDYERINPKTTTGNYAGGNPLVHIRAIPEGGTAGTTTKALLPYTFYDRYTPKDARGIDRRQPLPAVFAARYINGGRESFQTNFAIWREGVIGRDMAECSYAKNGALPLFTPMVVRFDEHENAVATTGCDENGCVYPTTGATTLLSAASPLLPPSPSGDVAGWIWINLDNGAGSAASSPYSSRRPSQNWIIVQMYAEGRYAVDFDATTIVNGCTVAPPTQP